MERSRLESFLHSAEVLKVHGLCDQVNEKSAEPTKAEIQPASKKLKKVTKNVTTTISPAFPLRPSSRNSPKAGPSTVPPPAVKSPSATVKVEEPNFSDEENHPEHLVIPSDPNSIRVTKQEALFDDNFGNCARPNEDEDSIAADSSSDTGK